ncbi:surface lipoprotein assembly modifier [Providencia huaxiensis]|uniref:surface lipoprotein assembly modifier n=1 Tax=Providencia huaxiensis TaxID=2027290 RepID=UPI0034DD2D7B
MKHPIVIIFIVFEASVWGVIKKAIAGGNGIILLNYQRYPLLGNHAGQFSFNIVGLEPMKTVSTKKISVLLNGGYQFEGANKKIQLLPIVETKWHDNQYHSLKLGNLHSRRIRIYASSNIIRGVELKNKNYIDKYNFNDGNKLSSSLISGYFLNPNLLFFSGIDVIRGRKNSKATVICNMEQKLGY